MTDTSPQIKRTTLFGVGLFGLFVAWALWHGIIGPRVIEPTPGVLPAASPAEETTPSAQ